nr:MAG TPA: hypothetical protein [Caudoviricetes sp.]
MIFFVQKGECDDEKNSYRHSHFRTCNLYCSFMWCGHSV